MTPFKGLLQHDPDNGVWGDCYRTAIGCLLDLPPDEVPHFADGGIVPEKTQKAIQAWLAPRHIALMGFPFLGELADVLRAMKLVNPGVHYLLAGQSRTGVAHVVVARDDRIVHDPSPSNPGIIGPEDDGFYWVHILAILV